MLKQQRRNLTLSPVLNPAQQIQRSSECTHWCTQQKLSEHHARLSAVRLTAGSCLPLVAPPPTSTTEHGSVLDPVLGKEHIHFHLLMSPYGTF